MKLLFKSKELRNKILIIFAAMVFIRIGSVIPIPGVNAEYMQTIMENSGLGFFNMLTGNSFSQMSLFALSISPYITASIIIQLLTVVFPSLEELRKDGKTGREKIERYTTILGIVLAFIQSLFMSLAFGGQGLLDPYTWWMVAITTIVWTAGAGILIFIGTRITKMEVGNGISYILICNILSTFPNDVFNLYSTFILNHEIIYQIINVVLILVFMLGLIAACVVLSISVRKIPMTFSRKMVGGNVKQDLPIPLNTCGVIPIIFSGSIMSLPVLISSFLPNIGWLNEVSKYLNQSYWFNINAIYYTLGVVVYIALTYFFTMFYLSINFNSVEMANNLKVQGAMIPGIRPGKPTADYIEKIASRIAVLGTTFMLAIILITTFICNATGLGTLSIGGTSILICVSVITETEKIFKTALQSEKSRYFYRNKKGESYSFLGLKRDERNV